MGMLIPGRAVLRAGIAVPLLCVAAALMVANAAHAARRGASHAARHGASHAATPALDAQAIDNAQFSAPSGKGRAPAPSAATIIKEEILLDRADFPPARSMARPAGTIKRRSPPSKMQTGSSRPAASMRQPGIA